MDNAARFLDAIKDAGIERIVIVDDALAPPELRAEDVGPLQDMLGDEALVAGFDARGINAQMRADALEALNRNELDEVVVTELWSRLYSSFVSNERKNMDPNGRFAAAKGDNARALRPFIKLLEKCDGVQVTWMGSEDQPVDFKELQPQLVFLDYILNENVSATEPAKDHSARETGVKASRRVLERIVKELPTEGPSVVLMSSDAEVAGEEADDFRHKAQGHLFSSRFQFVPKNELKLNGSKIVIETDAAGTLLDLTQCQAFGVKLNDALNLWQAGVLKAIKDLYKDIQDLELRDFAYLIRFRLAEEGQPLGEYLEWFFGELLLDRVGESVDWKHKSFTALNAQADGPGRHIEGMFDGATNKIAEMFSRVRVNRRKPEAPSDRKMGDLYMPAGAADEIRAVLTPDCDLMARGEQPRAARMLTVAGKLMPIHAPDVSAADFIEHDGAKYSIDWNEKDLHTLPFGEAGNHPYGMNHLGTLRPMYAYELQRRVLDDFGRVGLATAPAVHYTASSSAFTRISGKVVPLELPESDLAACSVVPSRGGSAKPLIVFHRGFVEKLIDSLHAFPVTKITKDMPQEEKLVASWLKDANTANWQSAVMRKLCGIGIEDGEMFRGIMVSIKAAPIKDERAMCQVLVRSSAAEAAPLITTHTSSGDDAALAAAAVVETQAAASAA